MSPPDNASQDRPTAPDAGPTPRTDVMQRIQFEGCTCIVSSPEDIEQLERELASARAELRAKDATIATLRAALELAEKNAQLTYKRVMEIAPWHESNDMDFWDELDCGLSGIEGLLEESNPADSTRLNWLESHWHDYGKFILTHGDGWSYRYGLDSWMESNIRTAIDKALAASAPRKETP